MTADELRSFEQEIADEFNAGKIRAPVHLDNGNEDQLIDYFRQVKESDWICGTWRQHYKCLLKGVPREVLKKEIMEGRSISLCFPSHRIVSSAIAGGMLPIAVGIAMGIKRAGSSELVHCFVGDMMAQSGIFFECVKYSDNFALPIQFVVEDNGISVCTDTKETCGPGHSFWYFECGFRPNLVTHYKYKSQYPHAGAGKRIQF